jgi:hypothetical protein
MRFVRLSSLALGAALALLSTGASADVAPQYVFDTVDC